MSKDSARLFARLLVFSAALFLIIPTGAGAQTHSPSLAPGNAVVTGFSGTLVPDTTKPRPASKSAVDLTFINPDGPSARIIGLGQPGFVWDGRLLAAPKTFDVLAKDVGQVFGIALDDQTPPNIYLAATSAFGLNIIVRGGDGLPERRKKGGPGAGWMKGQFGLELQGGPGSIYKVDGGTGVVTLLANVTLDGVPNPGPALGNLAYDAASKQLFVSDLYTGMIHRVGLDGKDLGTYDHGVTGLGAAGAPPVPFDPKNRPNIASDGFDSQTPATWGFAPPARRVWGLAVHEGRLYYSARNGSPTDAPQIWSVGIQQDGGFAADPRLELDVPAQAGPLPVSDIAFSHQGAMILGQRAVIAGAYDYSAFTQPGEPQVLRFSPKAANDPPSPGRWKPVPDEYAVGFAGDYRNTNGGVALGYGYGQDGMLDTSSCEAALWTTGQNLRNNPALRSQLEPGGALVVNGLQGSPADLVRNANTPPTISYFIDYGVKVDDAAASGHIGSVRVYTTPCAPAAYAQPPIAVAANPGGGSGGGGGSACTPTCVCPPGTVLEGKECVRRPPVCPPPQFFNPATGACACPAGTLLEGKECVRILTPLVSCQPPLVYDPRTRTCVLSSSECKPPLVLGPDGRCICPLGTIMQDGKCVPQVCPPPLVPGPCQCPEGTVQDGGLCVPVQKLGSLIVKKTVTSNTTNPLPATTPFAMTITCPPNPSFTLLANQTYTMNNIAFGTTCSVTEVLPALPAGLCPRGTVAVWSPAPTITPASVVISGTTTTITVHNSVSCVDKSSAPLSVTKTVSPDPRGIGSTLSFQITLYCTNPLTGSHVLTVHGNTSSVPISLPVGSVCTVSETQPILPPGCTWQAPVYSPATVTIGVGMNIEMVKNSYTCKGGPQTCTPPQVMNDAGVCACPATMVSGPVAGSCVCPKGTLLIGNQCEVAVDCAPPMIHGAAPGSCVCPSGTKLEGKECVKQTGCAAGTVRRGSRCVDAVECRAPARLNRSGTGCICPPNMVAKGNTCVRKEREQGPTRERAPRIGLPGMGPRGGQPDPGGGATRR